MMCRNITCSSNLHGIDVKETEETLIFFFFLELHFFFSASSDASHYRNLYENVNIKLKYCIILTKVNGPLIFT